MKYYYRLYRFFNKKRLIALKKNKFLIYFFYSTRIYFLPLTFLFFKIKNFIWFKFYLKNNEFHKSLDFDIQKYSKLSDKDKFKYQMDLIKKRNIAHELDMKEWK